MFKRALLALFLGMIFLVPASSSAACTGPKSITLPNEANGIIISDGEFKAKDTMSQVDIQNFLVSKGSALASYTINYDAMIGLNDWKNANGMSASQLIYFVAQEYSINPKMILVMLDKESSLVSSGTLNYLNSALGYTYFENGTYNPAYANFAKQIDGGIWQLYYNFKYSELADTTRVGSYYKGNTIAIDNINTTFGNSATASLYRYTPHRPDSAYLWNSGAYDASGCKIYYYGNYNFISYYMRWFGLQSSVVVTSPLAFNDNPYYVPAIGENIIASFNVKNTSTLSVTLSSYSVGMRYRGEYRDFSYGGSDILAPGQEKTLYVNYIFRERGDWYAWIKLNIDGQWFVPTQSEYVRRDYSFSTRLPSVNATWFLVPQSQSVGAYFTPELRLVNNEYSTVTLDSVGIASWLNWPTPNMRDFGYNSVNIPARTEISVTFSPVKLTETGKYRSWALYRVGNYWETLVHTTGYEDVTWIDAHEPNIKATWFLVPENTGRGTFTPELRIKNYEQSTVYLDAAGIACWKDWPQANMRDFGFQQTTLAPNEEKTLIFSPQTLTEVGKYRAWSPYSIGGNWYQLYHTTGYADVAWINVN